jgi:hypothetical protein
MSCRVTSFLFSERDENNTMKTMLYIMARLQGETLNQLFSVLEEWERNLKECFEESTTSVLLSELPPEYSPDI